jgi:hypothetical protein
MYEHDNIFFSDSLTYGIYNTHVFIIYEYV